MATLNSSDYMAAVTHEATSTAATPPDSPSVGFFTYGPYSVERTSPGNMSPLDSPFSAKNINWSQNSSITPVEKEKADAIQFGYNLCESGDSSASTTLLSGGGIRSSDPTILPSANSSEESDGGYAETINAFDRFERLQTLTSVAEGNALLDEIEEEVPIPEIVEPYSSLASSSDSSEPALPPSIPLYTLKGELSKSSDDTAEKDWIINPLAEEEEEEEEVPEIIPRYTAKEFVIVSPLEVKGPSVSEQLKAEFSTATEKVSESFQELNDVSNDFGRRASVVGDELNEVAEDMLEKVTTAIQPEVAAAQKELIDQNVGEKLKEEIFTAAEKVTEAFVDLNEASSDLSEFTGQVAADIADVAHNIYIKAKEVIGIDSHEKGEVSPRETITQGSTIIIDVSNEERGEDSGLNAVEDAFTGYLLQ